MEWLVCHDAGGAELVSAWAKANNSNTRSFVLEGPALKVFGRKFAPLEVCSREEFAQRLSPTDHVITGTGWASDLEKWAMKQAKVTRAKVTAYLDHWDNYAARFELHGQVCMPDEIWVADRYALDMAQKQFPNLEVIQVANDYLLQVAAEIKALENSIARLSGKTINILYVAEALSEHMGEKSGSEKPEFIALGRLFQWLKAHGPSHYNLRIRLHPAEKAGKYDSIREKHPAFPFEISPQTSLAQDCAWADWVAGMSSMALVVALAAGKKTLSCMPSPKDQCPLPHEEIQRI